MGETVSKFKPITPGKGKTFILIPDDTLKSLPRYKIIKEACTNIVLSTENEFAIFCDHSNSESYKIDVIKFLEEHLDTRAYEGVSNHIDRINKFLFPLVILEWNKYDFNGEHELYKYSYRLLACTYNLSSLIDESRYSIDDCMQKLKILFGREPGKLEESIGSSVSFINDYFLIHPKFLGVGVNVNKILEKWLG